MLVTLVCPLCLYDPGQVEFDNTARGACPACNVALMIATNVVPVDGFREPPPRQLARRVERPRRSKMKVRRDGERLVTSQSSWLLLLFSKQIELGPEGYTVRTWRKRGSTHTLAELRGFVLLQRCLALMVSQIYLESDIQLAWVSYVVLRRADEDLYAPLFLHGTHADGAYYCSLLNEHLATLRRGSDPYR